MNLRIKEIAILLMLCSANIALVVGQNQIWFDPNVDMDTRVEALVASMTLDEKISQTIDYSEAIPRLGVVDYQWWNEALHGVARSGRATVFPQAIGLAATFDKILMEDIGTAISDEARAIHNEILRINKPALMYQCLTFWSPNVNIFRDPRWGRGQETYGEDPFLSGQLGAAFIRGMQGNDEKYMKVAACAKHFAVHSGPEELRHEFNAYSNNQDLWETYLPAFKQCVDADVEAVMCAYNRTNDEACCGSNLLLQDVLLDQWKFKGHIVSDCGAIANFHNHHELTTTPAESAALALKRGVNLNCGRTYTQGLKKAVEQGLITENELDASLARLLSTRFKLGLFDPAEMNPYRSIGVEVINDEAKQQLSREAAQKSIVMLKNDNTLPLKKDIDFVYMSGPLANMNLSLVGNYNGLSSDMVTVVEGITRKVSPSTRLQYRQGALINGETLNDIDWFSGLAGEADATVVVLGLTLLLEGEEGESIASPSKGDILDMKLPESQMILLRKLNKAARKSGKKIITVICSGMPLDMKEVCDLSDAVLYAWYPGERGGEAVADLIFGEVSPSGKLPITFPESIDQLPDFHDYSMVERTYKYMTGKPLFPFGFGLSYADFNITDAQIEEDVLKNENTTLTVKVSNNSAIPAEEVLQLYVSLENDTKHLPLASLKSFQRVSLAANETKEFTFEITPDMFNYIDESGKNLKHKGNATITVSNASPNARALELGSKQVSVNVVVKK